MTSSENETREHRKRRLHNKRQISYYRKRQNTSYEADINSANRQNITGIMRHEISRMDQICIHCGAKFWIEEKEYHSSKTTPSFAVCCAGGKVRLPPLLRPPRYLIDLYTSLNSDATSFHKNIRGYNNLLACTSFGANISNEFQGRGVSNFKIHGQVYHCIGSLLPEEGHSPTFAQLYIYDTEHENRNRHNIMQDLDNNILRHLQDMLDECNPYIQSFRQARDIIQSNMTSEISMVIYNDRTNNSHCYNAPTSSDVAAIMVGDGYSENPTNRDICLRLHDKGLKRISETHPSYDPLHYVLLFPRGDDGWHINIPLIGSQKRTRVTPMQFYSYRLQIRNGDWIQYAGRLYQQYIVDQYAKIEQERLNYLRQNQKTLRTEMYQGTVDAMHAGDISNSIGRRIILPSSFIGGPRQMYQLYQDAMAIVSHFGKPDLFITFTCNPKWPEITKELLPHQVAADRPDLTARVFHLKLQELLKDLNTNNWFGKVFAYVYVVEFQKRGLPHAHILLILASEDKIHSVEEYDTIISAEIPDPIIYPLAYETVTTTMMHGPCGILNPSAPCMKNGICKKQYPKNFQENTQESENGYPIYRRRENGHFVKTKNGIQLDNRWVIPHNIGLVTKYNAHINVEICSSILAIKYLYMYIYKGHDRATIFLTQINNTQALANTEPIDEIKMYLDTRYVSASESIWRIFHYRLHNHTPSVQRLAVHLPNQQTITFQDEDNLQNIVNQANNHMTTLTAWFQENLENPAAHEYKYIEFPLYYTWNKTYCKWNPRKTTARAIGRLYMVQPSEGERYYLRMLLTHIKGAISFDDLKTINGHMCRSFKEACICLGLLQDDTEWSICLHEASQIKKGKQLRHLFAMILLYCQPAVPENLWNEHKLALCEDLLHQNHCNNISNVIEYKALSQLDSYLQLNGKSLKDFPNMPLPLEHLPEISNNNNLEKLIQKERLSYDPAQLESILSANLPLLNKDQYTIYNAIMQVIEHDLPQCFFIDGPGGTGKTFLYNTILAKVRLCGQIALPVASSGIAALLISGGRTAHTRFKIPIKLNETSTCNISRGSKEAHLINATKLFIWDEAPMMHKFAFEAVDRTFRDITQVDKPFGGKIFIFGGDFCQILPVIPYATRSEIVSASLNQSFLCKYIKIMKLTLNMRLYESDNFQNNLKQKEFAKLLLDIGDGKYPVIPGTKNMITLPSDLTISNRKLTDLIDFVYSDLAENYGNINYMVNRAILTPKNSDVDIISDIILNRFPGDMTIYPSADLAELLEDHNHEQQSQTYSSEFLRSLKIYSLPPGELKLKVGVPIILLRNLNPSEGLCNGTRLIVRGLQSRVIDAEIITGSYIGKRVFIPRITLSPSENISLPFTLKRLQFPIRVAFSMTINKSQGQSLNQIGIYLPEPVFAHGQLYVGLSRSTSHQHIKVLILHNACQNYQTKNIVYNEVFQNI